MSRFQTDTSGAEPEHFCAECGANASMNDDGELECDNPNGCTGDLNGIPID